ncbi:MAG TPA: M1 family metallopeptidase [Candidatus Sulfotelmatobacter sp.]|nr:M1 family metallopeptidase [Candidatus Sulfotelmatobacter sp.]
MANKSGRLYEQFRPSSYDLLIDIDKDKMAFSGSVVIVGEKVGRPSKRITLNSKALKIGTVKLEKLTKAGYEEVEVERVNHHRSFDELRVHAKDNVYPGGYRISLKFSGKISIQMHGIYPCFYKDAGKKKTLIATQFESHSAREAFPCVDEPEAKATFNLTLIAPKGEKVLSNTLPEKTTVAKGRTTTVFETTPKMSTYLLAFVVGDMHCVEAKSKDGVMVRSWASAVQPLSHLEFANSEAVKVLEFFTDYFATPFPLKKIDQVALQDFEAAAMENWGLITFRESYILTDPANRSVSAEQTISLVIAHELSHQWFGNLVTMKWWDDLWLNESFASLMENIAPDALHPEWHQWEDFATHRVLACSHRDVYKDVQPVGVKVKNPNEIRSLFDPAIVYAKGARILSMLYEYMGEKDFKKALRIYFDRHKYGNTTRHDLWKAMEEASGMDIDKLMTPWVEQSGQPLLSVNNLENEIDVHQQRYLLDGEDKTSLWPIPYLASIDLKPKLLDKRNGVIKYSSKEAPVFNVNGSGHYIVRYLNDKVFQEILKDFVDRKIGSISRITVINDMLLLARSGEYSLVPIIEMVKESYSEPRDAVWSLMSRTLSQAQVLTSGDDKTEKDVRRFKDELSRYWLDKLGWHDRKGDDVNTKHLRITALALSIAGENEASIKKALELYEKAVCVEKLPAELRPIIAGAAVRFGKKSYVHKMMDEYISTHNPDVRQAITVALCSTRDKDVAMKVIDWGLKKDGPVKPQDISYWFAYFMANHRTRDLIWKWFKVNWLYLKHLYAGGMTMDSFVWYSASHVSTPAEQKRFKVFFEGKKDTPGLGRSIDIAFGEIDARVAWRKREEKKIKEYFANQ